MLAYYINIVQISLEHRRVPLIYRSSRSEFLPDYYCWRQMDPFLLTQHRQSGFVQPTTTTTTTATHYQQPTRKTSALLTLTNQWVAR